jgi:hypothetical protein
VPLDAEAIRNSVQKTGRLVIADEAGPTAGFSAGTSSRGSGRLAPQCRAGNVKVPGAPPWNEELFRVIEGFPDLAHDDEVDACSGALEMLNPPMKSWGFYELTRQRARKRLDWPTDRSLLSRIGRSVRWNGRPSRRKPRRNAGADPVPPRPERQ